MTCGRRIFFRSYAAQLLYIVQVRPIAVNHFMLLKAKRWNFNDSMLLSRYRWRFGATGRLPRRASQRRAGVTKAPRPAA